MFYKLLFVLLVISGLQVLGGETEKPFSLEVKKDSVKIVNGEMSVSVNLKNRRTHFSGPYGKFHSAGVGGTAGKVNINADTDSEKSVSIFPKDSKNSLVTVTMTLTAKSDSPMIELKITKKNIGKDPVKRYFFYRLADLKFPYYYDKNGWQYAGTTIIPVMDWFFLLSANTTGGYGLIPLNRQNIKIFTIYPRKDWREVGLYFAPKGPRLLKPGKEAMIGFKIFTATSRREVIEQAQKKKR